MNLSSYTFTLAANACTYFSVTGKVFSCTASTGILKMSFNGGSYFDVQSNHVLESDEGFTSVWFRNESGSSISMTFYIGSVRVVNQGYEPKRAPTSLNSGGPYAIAGGASQNFSGSPTDPHIRQWVIQNLDAALYLHLRKADNTYLARLNPGQPFTIETSDSIQIYNPNGGAVSCDVFTIAYT